MIHVIHCTIISCYLGRHYSLPESARHCGIRESGEDRRANTFSVNHVTSSPSQNHSIPSSVVPATTEAHQESKATLLNNNQEENQCQLSSPGPQSLLSAAHQSTRMKQYVQCQPHHDSQAVSVESHNVQKQFSSPLNLTLSSESTPHCYCTPTHERSHQFLSDQKRRVSEISIPITLDASSTSSSMCGIPPPHPSSPMWLFQSDQSSGNVSEENILHSSSSCVDAEVSHKAHPSLCNNVPVGQLSGQRNWYELSSSVTSLPVDQHPGMFRGNSVSRVPPRNLPSDSGKQGGHPMFRSVSQEYYHQSPRLLSNFNRRRRHSCAHHLGSSSKCPIHSSGSTCSHRCSKFPLNNSHHSPHLPSCHCYSNQEHPHLHCVAVSSQQSLPTNYYNVTQVSGHCGCTCISNVSLEPPIEHNMSGTISNQMTMNAWSGTTCEDSSIGKNVLSKKVRCNYENNNDDAPPAYEQNSHCVITPPKEQTHLAERERESTQGIKYESQSLNRRKEIKYPQATSNSIQSLNRSSIDRTSQSTYRSRSSSAVAVNASNRSLSSENTLTSSTKSPITEPPPTTRSQGNFFMQF